LRNQVEELLPIGEQAVGLSRPILVFEGVLYLVFSLEPGHGVPDVELAQAFRLGLLKVLLLEVGLHDGWKRHEHIALVHGVVFDLLLEKHQNFDVLGFPGGDGEGVANTEFRPFRKVTGLVALLAIAGGVLVGDGFLLSEQFSLLFAVVSGEDGE